MLARGANVNARDRRGDTPLHLAAREGALAWVERLLAHGADPALRNREGQTPRDVASADEHEAVVDFLDR